MSVQRIRNEATEVEFAKHEIARAKLVTGLIALAVMTGSCAPSMVAKSDPAPASISFAAR